jgi:drug/metabolite transporter (DMT)-like permease
VSVTVTLSLVAALLFAVSAALQQRAAREAARRRVVGRATGRTWLPVLDVLGRLVRDRRWLAGWLAGIGGFGAHAAALHHGSIVVVQPLLTAQLLFALALGQRRPLRRDWLGTLAVCAGLVVLVTVHSGVSGGPTRRSDLPLAALVAAMVIAELVAVASLVRHRPQLRSALVAVAAGTCVSLSAVLLVVVTGDLSRSGVGAVASDWATLVLVASTSTSALLVQDAFASGSLRPP